MRPFVRVVNLGRLGFDKAFEVQNNISRMQKEELPLKRDSVSHSVENTILDTLLLVEHHPVYTIGLRDATGDADREKLEKLGAEFRKTNRGGLITFHGPGQLVVYPVINLKNFVPSVKWFVESMEETVIRLCHEFGLKGERSPHTGVWIEDNKICAIGVHASRYITTHGLALNCNTDLTWFEHIVPCGIQGKGVTSLSNELRKDITIDSVLLSFLNCFSQVFDCQLVMGQNSPRAINVDMLSVKL